LRSHLLLLLPADHVPGLVLLRHGGGPGLDHLLRLRHDRVPDLLLLRHGGHHRRGCEAFADGAEHLGLVRFEQRRYDGADDMCARALQARWTCLLLMDAGRDEEGKGGWEERYAALLELAVTLFHAALLREKQDRIAEAVVCCEETLRARREVVPDASRSPSRTPPPPPQAPTTSTTSSGLVLSVVSSLADYKVAIVDIASPSKDVSYVTLKEMPYASSTGALLQRPQQQLLKINMTYSVLILST
jgi:hypothetical protein